MSSTLQCMRVCANWRRNSGWFKVEMVCLGQQTRQTEVDGQDRDKLCKMVRIHEQGHRTQYLANRSGRNKGKTNPSQPCETKIGLFLSHWFPTPTPQGEKPKCTWYPGIRDPGQQPPTQGTVEKMSPRPDPNWAAYQSKGYWFGSRKEVDQSTHH